jgi:hypothetical protein
VQAADLIISVFQHNVRALASYCQNFHVSSCQIGSG